MTNRYLINASEIILEARIALKRNVTRSLLTMLGVVWESPQ